MSQDRFLVLCRSLISPGRRSRDGSAALWHGASLKTAFGEQRALQTALRKGLAGYEVVIGLFSYLPLVWEQKTFCFSPPSPHPYAGIRFLLPTVSLQSLEYEIS